MSTAEAAHNCGNSPVFRHRGDIFEENGERNWQEQQHQHELRREDRADADMDQGQATE